MFKKIVIVILICVCVGMVLPYLALYAFIFPGAIRSCNQKFIESVEREDIEAVNAFIHSQANLDCIYYEHDFKGGTTPLAIAAKENNPEIVAALLDGGANPEKALMGYGVTASSAAEIIIKQASLNQEQIDTLLISYSKAPNMMRHLLEKGADVNVQVAPKGWRKTDITTPLYQASYNTGKADLSHPEGVKLLLEKGANPNLAGYEGNLPLGAAAVNRNSDIINALIIAGADITKESACGFSPMIIAASHGHSSNVKILLDAGADPNSTDHRSRVKEECFNDRLMGQKRMRRLDQETADHRRKVLRIQDEKNRKEAYEHQTSPDMAAYSANRSIDGPYNGTPLMWAAYSCDADSVNLLLGAGAKINAQDAYGATALMWGYACDDKGYEKVVPILLKAGADPNIADSGGKKALDYKSNQ